MEGLTPVTRIVDDVRRTILSVPGSRPPRLDDVANALAVSPRTLERRLNVVGTNFRQISNDVRMQLAAQYVALGTMSSDEISRMLGYSQPSAFFRAFKLWFGMTPKQYRALRLPSSAADPVVPTSGPRRVDRLESRRKGGDPRKPLNERTEPS